MSSDLGTSRDGLQWVVDGYALVLASVMLSAGDIADLIGRRRVFVTGLLLFGVSSVICALAPSVSVLVAGRAIQGVGAAAILPTSLAIINNAFADSEERSKAIGFWAALGSVALIAGPLAGGALVDSISWRAIFWLNLPLVAVALGLTLALIEESRDPRERSIDFRGQLAAVGLLAGLVFFLIEGGRLGWAVPPVVTALIVAVLCAALFIRTELRRRDPMLQLGYFQNQTFSAANASSGLMNLGMLGALFAFGIYLQQDQGESPIQAGLHILPWVGTLAVFAVFGGRLAQRLGARLPAGLGLMTTGFSMVVVALLPSQDGPAALFALRDRRDRTRDRDAGPGLRRHGGGAGAPRRDGRGGEQHCPPGGRRDRCGDDRRDRGHPSRHGGGRRDPAARRQHRPRADPGMTRL
jgi:MFS transporter, DHA2 family, methylenomycin A resistance protein